MSAEPMPFPRGEKRRKPASKVFDLATLLPRDATAEDGLLGCAFTDGMEGATNLRFALAEGITPAHFFDADNRRVWSVLVRLVELGQPVETAGVWHELESRDELTPTVKERVVRLTDAQPTSAFLRRFVAALLDTERARQKVRAACGLVEALRDRNTEQAEAAERQLVEAGVFNRGRLPRVTTCAELLAAECKAPVELVAGVLHQGSKLMVGGGSKSFKSWLLIDLALSVATGAAWWGMKTAATRVLYLNFELAVWAFRDRLNEVAKAKGIEAPAGLDVWNLRGHGADLGGLTPYILTRARAGQYGLIMLDPIYKTLGDRDENAAGDIASLLNEIEALAVRTGAAVVFGHHFAKGAAAQKESRDRVSGSGVWARDPDTLVMVTQHEREDHFAVEFILRNHAPKPPLVVRWNFPLMEIAPGLDPAALKQPGRPREHGVDSLLQMLAGGGLSFGDLKERAEAAGMSEATLRRRIAEAKRDKQVQHVLGKWVLTT